MLAKDNNIIVTSSTMNFSIGGIYLSTDEGNTWIQKNDGLATFFKIPKSLALIEEYLFVAMNESFEKPLIKVFKAKIEDLLTTVDAIEKVEIINDGNFFAATPKPTPSSDLVNIKIYWDTNYDVENATKSVYDVLVNKIGGTNKIKTQKVQINSAELIWDCSNISNEVYFVVIDYNGRSKSIPVLIHR